MLWVGGGGVSVGGGWVGFCGLTGWESSVLERVEKSNFEILFFARVFIHIPIHSINLHEKETHAAFPRAIWAEW